MTAAQSRRERHANDERTVQCPVKGCDATPLARGVHLHVLQSVGSGHGAQGEVPQGVSFEHLETVGSREVEMDYPTERDTEQVARMCPYCERPFRGKNGVLIHLGQVEGRKNHPEDASELHDPEDFPVVHVDDNENVTVVEEGTMMPSSARRFEDADEGMTTERVRAYIRGLRSEGKAEEAERASQVFGVEV